MKDPRQKVIIGVARPVEAFLAKNEIHGLGERVFDKCQSFVFHFLSG